MIPMIKVEQISINANWRQTKQWDEKQILHGWEGMEGVECSRSYGGDSVVIEWQQTNWGKSGKGVVIDTVDPVVP